MPSCVLTPYQLTWHDLLLQEQVVASDVASDGRSVETHLFVLDGADLLLQEQVVASDGV
jgi:hypothetical protein